jgi:hypothetical protein
MNAKNKAVLGVYKTRSQAERAVDDLKANDFLASDISVLMPGIADSQDFAYAQGTKPADHAAEAAGKGAVAGAVLGGTLGLLVGVGALVIPGLGPLIAAGPIMAAMAGVGVGGAVGGLTGALIGIGIPEFEAKKFENIVKNGGILLSVHTDTSEEVARAKRCLENTGAQNICSTRETMDEWRSSSYQRKDSTFGANP